MIMNNVTFMSCRILAHTRIYEYNRIQNFYI